jgi:peptidoglycan hydrolase-like protein with peptidoglycan-binding domain
MTAAILTRLPLEAGGAVLAVTGRTVHSALAWGFAHYMKAPLASTGIAAMLTLSLMATSNALYFQHTRHPAPLFSVSEGGVDPTIAPVVPAPRPVTKKAAVTPKVVLPKVETTASVRSSDEPIGNTEVFELQRKLEALKLFNGTVDGYYGPKTAGAIRAFEEKAGMKPMGQLTPEIVKAILNAPLISAEPEPKPLPKVEPVPAADPLPKVTVEPVVQAAPMPEPLPQVQAVVEPEPEPQPQVTARIEVQPLVANKPLTRDLPDTPQEAVNIAVETAGDAIDTIVNGVQTLAMTKKPEPKPEPKLQAAPAPLQFASEPAAAEAVEPIVTASVAAVPVVAPQAVASTELQVKPQDVPVLDTEAKVEDLQGPFSVTDPSIVGRVQRGLASLGFLHGPVDGVPGEATAKAIRSFETFYNYERTGRITPELPDLLVKAGATL